MLVQEGPADCATAFETAGKLQATLGGNRCRESNHRLCWGLRIRCGGLWEACWVESNRARLSNGRDQLSDTAAGSLLIGCRAVGRLCACGGPPDLSKISLEHCPTNRVAIGRKDTTNSSDK